MSEGACLWLLVRLVYSSNTLTLNVYDDVAGVNEKVLTPLILPELIKATIPVILW